MIPGSSPPLRNCGPASGSSASISQSRASVFARAVNGALPAMNLDSRLRPRAGQQRRSPICGQHGEALRERDLRMQVEEMLLDCLLFEAGGAKAQCEARELAIRERQHGQIALLLG